MVEGCTRIISKRKKLKIQKLEILDTALKIYKKIMPQLSAKSHAIPASPIQ